MLEAVELTRKTPTGDVLLDRVSLRVAAGERWSVFGPTGAGKTLFLRALALLDAIDSGQVLWNESPIADADVPAYRRNVIYLHQRPALIEGTVEDNLKLPLSFHAAKDTAWSRELVTHYLDCIGKPWKFLERTADQLSGGERQIVALIRALLQGPQVLLLDEPTAALDRDSAHKLESLVQTYLTDAPQQRASVWITHDAAQVERVADWQLPIRAGQAGEPRRVG